jgi:SAM-dependent methyltransferase
MHCGWPSAATGSSTATSCRSTSTNSTPVADPSRINTAVGDARDLDLDDSAADAVLLGPIYHLRRRDQRLRALREAWRVVRPGGPVFVAAISRWAPRLDGELQLRVYKSLPAIREQVQWSSARAGRRPRHRAGPRAARAASACHRGPSGALIRPTSGQRPSTARRMVQACGWRPWRDSNLQPTDWKTAANRPRRTALYRPCGSDRMGRPASTVPWCGVSRGGLTMGITSAWLPPRLSWLRGC